jgi:hypothetical protein
MVHLMRDFRLQIVSVIINYSKNFTLSPFRKKLALPHEGEEPGGMWSGLTIEPDRNVGPVEPTQ